MHGSLEKLMGGTRTGLMRPESATGLLLAALMVVAVGSVKGRGVARSGLRGLPADRQQRSEAA